MAPIRGYLDKARQPRVTIIVHGARGELTLDAVIDTGFDGDLCLPVPVAIELGLELYGAQRVQLADGSIRSELVFIGKAGFAGQPAQEREQEREILLTEAEDALIGVGFLADWRLEIDFPKGAVYLHSH
jgi:predicted aspartyl protease